MELEAAETVVESLVKGLSGKVPKGVAACAETLNAALSAFGPRVLKPGPLLKAGAGLLDHKDGAVRVAVKDLAVSSLRRPGLASRAYERARQVELSRWLGASPVKHELTSKMRDAQKKEARSRVAASPPPLLTPAAIAG